MHFSIAALLHLGAVMFDGAAPSDFPHATVADAAGVVRSAPPEATQSSGSPSVPPRPRGETRQPGVQCIAGSSHAERLKRAGCPYCIAPWARYTYGSKHCGYYVGGGAPFYRDHAGKLHGEFRYRHEGTWGLDYNPWYSRVRLQWYHRQRQQDGEGQYEPDEHNNPLIPLFLR